MFLRLFFIFSLCLLPQISLSQKEYSTNYTIEDIKIDGVLNEPIWQGDGWAGDFVENYPNVNDKPSYQTEVKLVYTSDALYFAAKVYDHPDSISYFLTQRDNFGNADYVGLTLDTYGNSLNAFAFYVTSSGVELDALVNEENFDYSWNAVWKSRVGKMDNGWLVEMRIPYAAIRFPEKDVQTWKINFERQIRRIRETSYWNPVDPAKYGEVAQSGVLKGLQNIKPPVRLSFSPYAITYLMSQEYPSGQKTVNSQTNAGVDLKWGINDAFTLDMMLVPDFGQTISDNQILNLGPFEVQFAENRSFFKEGTDLFGIGGVFYSRRIGGNPFNSHLANASLNSSLGESITEMPTSATLINATKVSGRTKKGLGIGVFNAIEGRAYAVIQDSMGNRREVETNPLTNYNVTVFSQNLPNNGRVSLLNTHVARERDNRDANVSVFNSQFFSKDRNYTIQSGMNVSNIFENGAFNLGHSLFTAISKVQGRFNYGFTYYEESDTYDPNDLGFLYANNSRGYVANWSYKDFVAKGRFLRKFVNGSIAYEELYSPNKFSSLDIDLGLVTTFRNFLTAGINSTLNPIGSVDFFESRTFGVPVNFGPSFRVGGFYSSDYSKPLALDVRADFRQFFNSAQNYYRVNVAPRFQFSSRFFMVYSLEYEKYTNDYGFVARKGAMGYDSVVFDNIILGTRDRDVVTNSIFGELVFSKRMGMGMRFRHYWQQVDYHHFSALQNDGEKSRIAYDPRTDQGHSKHNTSFNAFTIDINYKYVFFPGCEFFVFFKNNIFASNSASKDVYLRTFDTLFDNPQVNSLSAKLLVFVDVLYFKRKRPQF